MQGRLQLGGSRGGTCPLLPCPPPGTAPCRGGRDEQVRKTEVPFVCGQCKLSHRCCLAFRRSEGRHTGLGEKLLAVTQGADSFGLRRTRKCTRQLPSWPGPQTRPPTLGGLGVQWRSLGELEREPAEVGSCIRLLALTWFLSPLTNPGIRGELQFPHSNHRMDTLRGHLAFPAESFTWQIIVIC